MGAAPQIDVAHARIGADFGDRALGQHRAFDENRDPLREPENEAHIVLDHEDRQRLGKLQEEIEQRPAIRRREPRRRLVQQQNFGLQGKDEGDLDEAALAIRQVGDSFAGEVEQPETVQERRRSSPNRASKARPTFSATVRVGKSELIWKVRASPSATRRSGETWVMSVPARWIVPAEGWSNPLMILTSVVLPAPFGPISAWRAPIAKDSEMLRATRSPPKFLEMPAMDSAASLMPGSASRRDGATNRR